VSQVADASGLSIGRVILGGDHLGPNRWRGLSEGPAMGHVVDLVRCYVKESYENIHLDASMHLAGDTGDASEPPAEDVVAERTALLAQAAEEAA
jgi:D-tagatose-1,6-bisphosphate aldolase subunit GatZ/KbaZ